MELRHLHYFKAVAEELHFGRAADRLHISQPPLTRQIKDLEKELGIILFYRNNKRVELTNAGRYFLKECDQLMQQLEKAKLMAKQLHHAISGDFRLGYISSTPKKMLADILKQIKNEFPYLHVYLFETSSQKQKHALENGKLDLGILRAPIFTTDLKVDSLFKDSFCLATPKGWKGNMDAVTLMQEDFISYNSNYATDYHHQIIACANRIGFHPQIVHECNTMHSILELVANGLGIAFVPASVAQQETDLLLDFHELKENEIQTEIIMAYDHKSQHPVLHTFITLIKEYYAVNY
ncbi:LysR substrate-binding domain-containing protein [Sphingobacterium sp. SRCM116780]|uniref:LysR family transcriptional regulator n=1 Tax=Sphingobacterium sp. SRCM116780 TaxID=2907623 RepID=UPI001F1A7FA4|nr:LysR substrate-binding domain-containing protein [Sphingobacterium sp. SRCM116780]UIR57169.1 LysR substrate-binding domain-containing protein [Sphingobacterium sp. SRCM116780]